MSVSLRGSQQHSKIADYLRGLIRSKKLSPGDFLPSEAELCEQFSSSRGPVRQAVAALRSEGLISSGRGRRSVVLGRFTSESFDSIFSVTHWLRERGFEPGAKTLWLARCPATEQVANFLQVAAGDPVIFVHRVRSANGFPICIERMFFPLDVGSHILNFDADNGSIHDHLGAQGVEFDNVNRELSLASASEEDARSLNIEPGTPLWRLHLDISDHSGHPVECTEILYLGDRLTLGMTSVRGTTSPLEVKLSEG
ncbi:GntR family transcriptional regulator [Corynebacterium sp. HMSC078H07]|uniref:GntR family transcriptional regulator n=1 Tax=Corynebacterium sp. HMSC078H07 TaxID=1739379 RepID=UPI00352B33D5